MAHSLPCVVQNRPSLCLSANAAASGSGTGTAAVERLDRLEAQQGVLLDEMRSRFDALERALDKLG